jgi:cation:H+ antiporter
MDFLILLGALVIILLGAELFTNGIEWFGRKLNLAEGAVGSVLAAVGTALPETMIPIVAILFGGSATTQAGHDAHGVGVGAILGAPFMLATLAMFVTGTAVVIQGRSRPAGDRMIINAPVLGKDVRYFFIAYGLAIASAFLPPDAGLLRIGAAVLLLLVYGIYVREHFTADPEVDVSDLAPLRFQRLDRLGDLADPATPRLRFVNIQVVAALLLILVGAVFFVDAVQHLATQFGIAPAILSLVIAPIATELPEKFNSIIWVRQGKDTLAMGNITGAMVFQSCIPTIFALLLASEAWSVDLSSTESVITFASAGIAFISTAVIFVPMMRRGVIYGRGLLIGGALYGAYLALVVAFVAGII